MALGTLRFAFLTSSAMTAVLAKPPYAKKKKTAPLKTPILRGWKGWKFAVFMNVKP